MSYIVALDQGTTSCRSILYDAQFRQIAISQKALTTYYPKPGWVEQDAVEIWNKQWETLLDVIEKAHIQVGEISALGITNQRETTVIWDGITGLPVYPAIVWQDRRTADKCRNLTEKGYSALIRDTTGLIPDAYFSATKIQWILQQARSSNTNISNWKFGTIDSWLIWNLTQQQVHATDHSNASRTMLYNLHSGSWDASLIDLFEVPAGMLPQINDSCDHYGWAQVGTHKIPIRGVAGDQQAALYGQGCYTPGSAKNTYGTGCFMLMNTGSTPVKSNHGLLSTVAWSLNQERTFALEGSVFSGGSVIQWLRDELGLLKDHTESASIAATLPDNDGVYLVPAFTGLGAPYWDMEARGLLCGLTRGSGIAHLVRAALESIAYQSLDVLLAMEKDSGIPLERLQADGGATENKWLMQFQANILQRQVITNRAESTALGAALLAAGMKPGEFVHEQGQTFHPQVPSIQAEALMEGWHLAVKRALL